MNKIVAGLGLVILVGGLAMTLVITFIEDWVRVGIAGDNYTECSSDVSPIGTLGLYSATYDPSCVADLSNAEAKAAAAASFGQFPYTESSTTEFWPLFPTQTAFGAGNSNFTDCASAFAEGGSARVEGAAVAFQKVKAGFDSLDVSLNQSYYGVFVPQIEAELAPLNGLLAQGYAALTAKLNGGFATLSSSLKAGYENEFLPKFVGNTSLFATVDLVVDSVWKSQLSQNLAEGVVSLSEGAKKITSFVEGYKTATGKVSLEAAMTSINAATASDIATEMCTAMGDCGTPAEAGYTQAAGLAQLVTIKGLYVDDFSEFLHGASAWTTASNAHFGLETSKVNAVAFFFNSVEAKVELQAFMGLIGVCQGYTAQASTFAPCLDIFQTVNANLTETWTFCTLANAAGLVSVSGTCSAKNLFAALATDSSALDGLVSGKPEYADAIAKIPALSAAIAGCAALGKEWNTDMNYTFVPPAGSCQAMMINPTGNYADQNSIPENMKGPFLLCAQFTASNLTCSTFLDFISLTGQGADNSEVGNQTKSLAKLFGSCEAYQVSSFSGCKALLMNPTGKVEDQNQLPSSLVTPFALCLSVGPECKNIVDFLGTQPAAAKYVPLLSACVTAKVLNTKQCIFNPTGDISDQTGFPSNIASNTFRLALKYNAGNFFNFMVGLAAEREEVATLSNLLGLCMLKARYTKAECMALIASDPTGALATSAISNFLDGDNYTEFEDACEDDVEDARRIKLAQKLVPSAIGAEGVAVLLCVVYIIAGKKPLAFVAGLLAIGGTAMTLSALLLVRGAPVYAAVGQECAVGDKCYVAGTAQTFGYVAILLPILSSFFIIGSAFCGSDEEGDDELTAKVENVYA